MKRDVVLDMRLRVKIGKVTKVLSEQEAWELYESLKRILKPEQTIAATEDSEETTWVNDDM